MFPEHSFLREAAWGALCLSLEWSQKTLRPTWPASGLLTKDSNAQPDADPRAVGQLAIYDPIR